MSFTLVMMLNMDKLETTKLLFRVSTAAAWLCVSLLLLSCCQSVTVCADRSVLLLDEGFRFELDSAANSSCPGSINSSFPLPYDGIQCMGLSQASAAQNYDDCANICCGLSTCEVFQWCATSECSPLHSCWIGNTGSCSAAAGWQSRARNAPPPPTPGSKCNDVRCASNTDDSQWRSLTLPHDFVVEGTFTQTADASHGFLPGNIGWYRRHFDVPQLAEAVSVWIEIEAAMSSSTVWLNDIVLGWHGSGYTPARYDINSTLLKNTNNVLVIQVSAITWDGWWYDGGGLYRHVFLTLITNSPGPYLGPNGIYVPSAVTGAIHWLADGTPQADATISPSVEVWSNVSNKIAFNIDCTVKDQSGEVLAFVSGSGAVASTEVFVWQPAQPIALSNARLWHLVAAPTKPALYWFEVTLKDSDGVTIDSWTVRFGIRSTEWDAASGFYLNGVATKILGAANHQDFAGVGVAVPDHLQWYRIQKLKDMGANGWRTAHNTPNPALLEAADELGFLVWDENHRNGQDSEATIMVRRDRNHPSIIIWSICNEVLCNTDDSYNDAVRLNKLIHSLDPLGNRTVSANNNDWIGLKTPLDLQGFDYNPDSYDQWHAAAPNIPSISSESSSCVGDRGEYANDQAAGHVSGYDVLPSPDWPDDHTAAGAWGGINIPNGQGILTRSFIAGGWTWTGFDYKGEPSPYGWPDVNSHYGIIDIAGFPKDRYYWYKIWYQNSGSGSNTPAAVYLYPHWNWESATGNISLWAYSNADAVELFVNGFSFGRQKMPRYAHVEWSVAFAPGVVEAVAYNNDIPVAIHSRQTVGDAARVQIGIHDDFGSQLVAGCKDVALVYAEIVDAKGEVVPNANHSVSFKVSGASAIILGTGNGDPSSHVSDKSTVRPAFHGHVLAIIQAGDDTGVLQVTAFTEELGSAQIDIPIIPKTESLTWCHENYAPQSKPVVVIDAPASASDIRMGHGSAETVSILRH